MVHTLRVATMASVTLYVSPISSEDGPSAGFITVTDGVKLIEKYLTEDIQASLRAKGPRYARVEACQKVAVVTYKGAPMDMSMVLTSIMPLRPKLAARSCRITSIHWLSMGHTCFWGLKAVANHLQFNTYRMESRLCGMYVSHKHASDGTIIWRKIATYCAVLTIE
jgi:hypothetical protein